MFILLRFLTSKFTKLSLLLCHARLTLMGFPGGLDGKESTCNAGYPNSIPGEDWTFLGQEDPWRRACQPTPVFLPGESPWTEEPWILNLWKIQKACQTKQILRTLCRQTSWRYCGFSSRPLQYSKCCNKVCHMIFVSLFTKEANFWNGIFFTAPSGQNRLSSTFRAWFLETYLTEKDQRYAAVE